jgi:hypothetical protein
MKMFDLSGVDAGSTMEVLPIGEYRVLCIESTVGETKKKDNSPPGWKAGKYIKATFEVVEPVEHKGRRLNEIFNFQNQNEKAVEIGLQNIKRLFIGAGKTAAVVKHPDELLGLATYVKTKIDEKGYSRISKFLVPDQNADNSDDIDKALQGTPVVSPTSSKKAPAAKGWG